MAVALQRKELRINARARSRRPTQTKKEASVKDLVKMPKQAAEGVVFPHDGKGVRSTTAAESASLPLPLLQLIISYPTPLPASQTGGRVMRNTLSSWQRWQP